MPPQVRYIEQPSNLLQDEMRQGIRLVGAIFTLFSLLSSSPVNLCPYPVAFLRFLRTIITSCHSRWYKNTFCGFLPIQQYINCVDPICRSQAICKNHQRLQIHGYATRGRHRAPVNTTWFSAANQQALYWHEAHNRFLYNIVAGIIARNPFGASVHLFRLVFKLFQSRGFPILIDSCQKHVSHPKNVQTSILLCVFLLKWMGRKDGVLWRAGRRIFPYYSCFFICLSLQNGGNLKLLWICWHHWGHICKTEHNFNLVQIQVQFLPISRLM